MTLEPLPKLTLEEAIQRFDVAPIIKVFGTWAVTVHGVECLVMYYHFAMRRVDEMDWVVHLQGKRWMTIDMIEDFEEALSYARELNKIRETLSVSNEPIKAFLCHGTEDKVAVRELYNKLKGFGVKPWLDEEDLLPGQDWRREINKAIKATHVVIVCLSEKSIAKTGYVQKEIKYALDLADERPEGSIFIIPAKLEECSLPDRLSSIQWVDLFKENGFERLVQALQACVAQK
jgi:uncharacterized protein YlaI